MVEKKANFPLIVHVIFEGLILVYNMCCKNKIRKFRSAGKHVNTPRESTPTHRHRDICGLFYRYWDEPSCLSFAGNVRLFICTLPFPYYS